jgi:hypothetical protein
MRYGEARVRSKRDTQDPSVGPALGGESNNLRQPGASTEWQNASSENDQLRSTNDQRLLSGFGDWSFEIGHSPLVFDLFAHQIDADQ